jgi:hypothetical protein
MPRLLVLLALVLTAVPALASDWGGIHPGTTTVEQVRARYGNPSKESRPKVEGYETQQLVYEGDRAPTGMVRMTVDFGILAAGAYKPNVVRLLTLEPKPAIFGRNTVIQGWGVPDGVADNKDGSKTLVWNDGLLAVFEKDGENARALVFSVPQPLTAGGSPGAAPPPASPPTGSSPAPGTQGRLVLAMGKVEFKTPTEMRVVMDSDRQSVTVKKGQAPVHQYAMDVQALTKSGRKSCPDTNKGAPLDWEALAVGDHVSLAFEPGSRGRLLEVRKGPLPTMESAAGGGVCW